MPTTIQVKNTTRQKLELLKREQKASSYDAVINQLLPKGPTPREMFGSCKNLPSWTKKDRLRFRYE